MLSETRFRKTANRRGHGISFEVKVTFRGICEQQKKGTIKYICNNFLLYPNCSAGFV